MKQTFALLALILLAPLGIAQEDDETVDPLAGTYLDAQGETTATHDLVSVSWSGTEATVIVNLNGELDHDAGITVILFEGSEGTPEPNQAYILHHGPGGDRVALASPGAPPALTVMATNNSVTFQMDTTLDGPCLFAVARTVSYHEGGQTVEDVVGWTDADIENAWNGGLACSQGQPLDAPAAIGSTDVGVPMPGIGLLAVGLLGVAAVLRRTQRS